MISPKLIDIGFTTVFNEEECIRGWIKQALYFCKDVYILLDPTSSDNTEKIIRTEFPQVHLRYQDRTLGDADRNTPGKTAIWHCNQNKFIKEIPKGKWFMFYDCDERFEPKFYDELYAQIQYAQKNDIPGIFTKIKYEHIKNEEFVVNFNCDINQILFWKKGETPIVRKTDAHGGWIVDHRMMGIKLPFYHFSRIKTNKEPFVWYDKIESSDYFQMQKNFGHINFSKINSDFKNWRDLEGVEY